jgi:hypothetical protein
MAQYNNVGRMCWRAIVGFAIPIRTMPRTLQNPGAPRSDALARSSSTTGHLLNVRYWHLTDNPTAPTFVRYWSNCGHWSALALNG